MTRSAFLASLASLLGLSAFAQGPERPVVGNANSTKRVGPEPPIRKQADPPPPQPSRRPLGYLFYDLDFDRSNGASSNLPKPEIPSDWKFIGIGPGSAVNGSALWFEGPNRELYVMHGFVVRDGNAFGGQVARYILDPTVGRLAKRED